MIPTADRQVLITVIVVAFVAIAALLLAVLVGTTVRQQRRYLRARQHLGGRLLVAQDEERAAIARELHDDSVQRLIASAARLRMLDNPGTTSVADDIDHLVNDLRDLARGLHPAVVDQVGLHAALTDLCAAFQDRDGISVDYIGPSTPEELAPGQRLAFYRVAQEALGNVARHAQVDRATVRLSSDARQTQLVIEDHGSGFDQRGADSGPGIGITSMGERLAILGGTLNVDSNPGRGTRVTAALPRRAPQS